MPAINKVILIGNLTRDPETKYTPKGSAVTEFGMAINRKWTDESGEKREETTFVDIVMWGKGGEIVQKYVTKGDPLYLEGRLQLDTWDDKETGKKRSKLRVIGEQFQFLASAKGGSSAPDSPATPSEPRNRNIPANRTPSPALAALSDDLDREEDDIPF